MKFLAILERDQDSVPASEWPFILRCIGQGKALANLREVIAADLDVRTAPRAPVPMESRNV